MAENVSEIVSGLAGIRSGLSVISENLDTINELAKKGEEIKSKIKSRKDEHSRFLGNRQAFADETEELKININKLKYGIEYSKEKIERVKSEISEARWQATPGAVKAAKGAIRKNARRHAKKTLKESKIPVFPGDFPGATAAKVIITILIISAVVFYAISSMGEADVFSYEVEAAVYVGLVIANLVYPIGCPLVFIIRYLSDYNTYRKNSIRRQINEIYAKPHNLSLELQKIESDLKTDENRLQMMITEYNQNLKQMEKSDGSAVEQERRVDAFVDKAKYDISVINDDIKKIRNNSIAIKQALIETYKDLLNPADWQHIDVIMYYIETHRADSIKEALNIIDSKLQFEQLTNVIVSSAQAVCGYIQRGFIKLNDNLTLSHNMIMDKLADIECKVDTNTNLIGSTAHILAKGIDRQVAEARLNNALVKKAHKQVGELLEDMELTTQVNVTVRV